MLERRNSQNAPAVCARASTKGVLTACRSRNGTVANFIFVSIESSTACLLLLTGCTARFLAMDWFQHLSQTDIVHMHRMLQLPEEQHTYSHEVCQQRLASAFWLRHENGHVVQLVRRFMQRHHIYFATLLGGSMEQLADERKRILWHRGCYYWYCGIGFQN